MDGDGDGDGGCFVVLEERLGQVLVVMTVWLEWNGNEK